MKRSLLSSQSEGVNRRQKARLAHLSLSCTPLIFLLAGFTWLSLSFLLGVAMLFGLVNGTPLPHWLKPVHVHGTLLGGLLQLIIGGLLFSLARADDRTEASSHSSLFWAFNGATVGLLVSFWLGHMTMAGLAALVLIGIVAWMSPRTWLRIGNVYRQPAGAGWIARTAFIALVLGLIAGAMMAFRVIEGYHSYFRLLHIHFLVLGFLTVTFILALHQILPVLTRAPLASHVLARISLWFLPVGFAVLISGFVLSSLWLQIAVGGLLVAAVTLCTYDFLVGWIKSGSPGNAASDHLLIGACFLFLTTVAGLAMAANYLRTPPVMPIGSLHLVAYTHLAFIGFMAQVVCGSLSTGVPAILAVTRVPNSKKREAYRAQLDGVMNRWRTIQLAGMSLGTMSLAVLAALTWNVPLGSLYVQITVWIGAGLLIVSLTLFAVKLTWAVGLRPS
ncbi:MAG TPA: hypothetical protein VFQ02_09475 [Nitrospira sp.]|nr:hypothetical protein [Nitrospira sp.]